MHTHGLECVDSAHMFMHIFTYVYLMPFLCVHLLTSGPKSGGLQSKPVSEIL